MKAFTVKSCDVKTLVGVAVAVAATVAATVAAVAAGRDGRGRR